MLRTPSGVLLEGESEEEILLQNKKMFLEVRLTALKAYQETNDKDWIKIIKDLDENYKKLEETILASSPEIPSKTDEPLEEENRELGNQTPNKINIKKLF